MYSTFSNHPRKRQRQNLVASKRADMVGVRIKVDESAILIIQYLPNPTPFIK